MFCGVLALRFEFSLDHVVKHCATLMSFILTHLLFFFQIEYDEMIPFGTVREAMVTCLAAHSRSSVRPYRLCRSKRICLEMFHYKVFYIQKVVFLS